jgi:hypothetical protein
MSTVEDLLHSRWHRIRERVTVLLCLKGTWDHVENHPSGPDRLEQMDGVEAPAQRVIVPHLLTPSDLLLPIPSPACETPARDKIPKELWREILEYL